jgi:hypothetical protein
VDCHLLLKNHVRAADSLALEVYIYFNTVGNLDKGDATVHSEFLPVKGHRTGNLTCAFIRIIKSPFRYLS